MAGNIFLTIHMQFASGDANEAMRRVVDQIAVTGSDYVKGTARIGTVEEAIDKGGIASFGYIFIHNQDTNGSVWLRAAPGESNCLEIRPGELAVFRIPPAANPRLISDFNGTPIEYLLTED